MNRNRKNAIIAGALFIVATTSYSIGASLLEPLTSSPTYLSEFSVNQNLVVVSALLVLLDVIAVIGIAIVLYSILKKQSAILALGYICARTVEALFFCMSVIATLTLLTLSQDPAMAASVENSSAQTFGTMLLTVSRWSDLLGLGFAFAISALILNYILFKAKLVPRWLSLWGGAGAILVVVNFFIELFGLAPVELLFVPIAIQEMVFAVWLIVKGFYQPEV